MKKLFFISAIALFGITNVQAETAKQTGRSIATDATKWEYVANHLGDDITQNASLINSIGSLLHNYPVLISAPAAIITAINYQHEIAAWCLRHRTRTEQWLAKNFPFTVLVNDCKSLGIGLATFILVHQVTKLVGRYGENKPERCVQALNRFVAAWDEHKNYFPEALEPLFEQFSQEFKTKNAIVSITVDAQQALVENILATGLVASQIKNQLVHYKLSK